MPHFCLPFSFSPAAVPAPAPAAFAASSPRIFEAAMNLNAETKCQPDAQPASIEMRRTVSYSPALMSPLSPNLPTVPSSTHLIPQTQAPEGNRPTHPLPHHPPKPLTYSACTAVIPTRFSISARCAFNCANCACRCVYCLLRLIVEAEAEVKGWGRDDVEGWWDEADIMKGCWVTGVWVREAL